MSSKPTRRNSCGGFVPSVFLWTRGLSASHRTGATCRSPQTTQRLPPRNCQNCRGTLWGLLTPRRPAKRCFWISSEQDFHSQRSSRFGAAVQQQKSVTLRYGTSFTGLLREGDRVVGLSTQGPGPWAFMHKTCKKFDRLIWDISQVLQHYVKCYI